MRLDSKARRSGPLQFDLQASTIALTRLVNKTRKSGLFRRFLDQFRSRSLNAVQPSTEEIRKRVPLITRPAGYLGNPFKPDPNPVRDARAGVAMAGIGGGFGSPAVRSHWLTIPEVVDRPRRPRISRYPTAASPGRSVDELNRGK